MNDSEWQDKKLPAYWKEIYGWLYGSYWNRLLDNDWFLTLITFGANRIIRKALLKEISPGAKVLQLGATYGSQMEDVARAVGRSGRYDVLDVSQAALHRVKEKYQYLYPQMHFINQNANRAFRYKDYDVIICYNLLHEVPAVQKSKIVNNALNSIKPGGEAVFIDYHNPKPWHPLRWIIKSFNRLYEPFAEKLWENEIFSYSDGRLGYKWHKITYFHGLYQKAVATKKYPLFFEQAGQMEDSGPF